MGRSWEGGKGKKKGKWGKEEGLIKQVLKCTKIFVKVI